MTELILKNRLSRKKLNSIIFFLRTINVDVEIKKTALKKVIKINPFADTFGMWEKRDIDATVLRRQAWGLETN